MGLTETLRQVQELYERIRASADRAEVAGEEMAKVEARLKEVAERAEAYWRRPPRRARLAFAGQMVVAVIVAALVAVAWRLRANRSERLYAAST